MSRRHEHHRNQRAQAHGDQPLTATEIRRLNAQRRLPPGHPSADKDYHIESPLDLAWHAIDVIELSGVVPYLERRLRSHPGQTSALSVLALLVAMVVGAYLKPSYRRTDLCAVLHGLDAEVAYELGLCSRVVRKLFSYNTIVKQSIRLEQALAAGWVDEDGTKCDQDWFAHNLLKANITPTQAERITAIAIDSTFVLAWAVPYSYPQGEKPPSGKRSADPAAEFGHRSATAKRKAGKRLGFDLHVICGVRSSRKWQGNPKKANLDKESVPLVPLHLKLVPANPDVAPIAWDAIGWAKKIAPNATEVLADRLYTMKRERFNRRLHQEAMRVVTKLDKRQIRRVRTLILGTNQHELIENCGTFLPAWLDEELHKPPPELKGKDLTDWFDKRAKYRYSVDEVSDDDGSIRFWCPQCAGRIRSNLKTRNPKVKVKKGAPLVVRTDGATHCCPGRVTVPVEYLDRFQSLTYGTTAWRDSDNRRNQIENLMGILRSKGGLDDRWCHALGDGARFVGAMMLAVAYLLRETKQVWLNGDCADDPETPDGIETESQEVDDEAAPDSEGDDPTGRSRAGPS